MTLLTGVLPAVMVDELLVIDAVDDEGNDAFDAASTRNCLHSITSVNC